MERPHRHQLGISCDREGNEFSEKIGGMG